MTAEDCNSTSLALPRHSNYIQASEPWYNYIVTQIAYLTMLFIDTCTCMSIIM